MKEILVATDLTLNSDRALERAINLANTAKAKLHVLHVAPSYFLPGKSHKLKDLNKDKFDLINSYLSNYSASKSIKVDIHVVEGEDVYAEIIEYANTLNVNLVVMGLHNKVGFSDLFKGTTVERVIRTGIVPVLMVKEKPAGPYKKLLVGVDFSDSSDEALRHALRIVPEAKINLVHSYEISKTTVGEKINLYAGDVLESIQEQQLDKYAEQNTALMKKYKIKEDDIKYYSVQGKAYDVLSAEVTKSGSELLAIGCHSRSGFIPSKLGGIAGELLANPPCDILVCERLARALTKLAGQEIE